MLASLGTAELVVIVIVALLRFSGRIGSVGTGLGRSIQNFRSELRDDHE